MHLSSTILFSCMFAASVTGKRGRPNGDPDDTPGNPGGFSNPKGPGDRNTDPDSDPMPQETMKANLNNLELNLRTVTRGGDALSLMIDAILNTRSVSRQAATITNGPATATTSRAAASIKARKYRKCMSYASQISSCSSTTTSFYTLLPSEQASCACYIPETTAVSCGASSTQEIVVQTYSPETLDDNAKGCFDFLNEEGYDNSADVLSGDEQNGTFGIGFCRNMEDFIEKSGTNTARLAEVKETSSVGQCLSNEAQTTGSASRPEGLTSFDRIIFITGPVVIAGISYLFFL